MCCWSQNTTVPEDPQRNTAEMYQQVQETMCKKRQHDDDNDDAMTGQCSLEIQDYTSDEGNDSTDSDEERASEYKNQSKKRKFY